MCVCVCDLIEQQSNFKAKLQCDGKQKVHLENREAGKREERLYDVILLLFFSNLS